MILKTCLVLVLSVAWEVSGASFSNVYVQTGPELVPQGVKFLEYGVPSYPYVTPQIAQLSAAQLGSVFSLAPGYEAPCIPGPCLIPERTVATVASVAPNANVVAYQASVPGVPVQSGPVVYSPKGQTSYEYMYSIYNQLHSERSDGAVVSGEYALLQPNGIVRDVQYVADDVKGFNAIVKNFLPVETKPTVVVAQPCPDIKSEPLVVVQDTPLPEINDKPTEPIPVEPSSDVTIVEEQPTEPATPEAIVVQEPEPVPEDNTHENIEVSPEVETTTLVEAPVEQVEEHHEEPPPVTTVEISDETVYVPYNDVIKCIQAAMSKLNGNPSIPSPATPLSYIILNKPC